MLPYEISPSEVKALVDAGEKLTIVDVREPHEHAVTRIEGIELIPMNTVPRRLPYLEGIAEERRLIVMCHHGVRSLNVVNWLRQQGVEACQSMSGGIDLWSLAVDPSVPRY